MCSYISVEAYLCICFTFQCECLYGGSRVQEEDESFRTVIYFASNLRPTTRPSSSLHPLSPTTTSTSSSSSSKHVCTTPAYLTLSYGDRGFSNEMSISLFHTGRSMPVLNTELQVNNQTNQKICKH